MNHRPLRNTVCCCRKPAAQYAPLRGLAGTLRLDDHLPGPVRLKAPQNLRQQRAPDALTLIRRVNAGRLDLPLWQRGIKPANTEAGQRTIRRDRNDIQVWLVLGYLKRTCSLGRRHCLASEGGAMQRDIGVYFSGTSQRTQRETRRQHDL